MFDKAIECGIEEITEVFLINAMKRRMKSKKLDLKSRRHGCWWRWCL